MTAATSAGRRSRAGRGIGVAVAVVAALLVVGVLTVTSSSGAPYDPDSAGRDGTRALVQLLRTFGAVVEVPDRFPTDADVAVAFENVVPEGGPTDVVRRWVGGGRTLVMADPTSVLTPAAVPTATIGAGGIVPRGRCTIDALRAVGQLDLGEGPATGVGLRYVDRGPAPVCFAAGGEAFAVSTPVGAGQVVGLASPDPFTNANLGRSDNAVLATALLAPRPGTRVAVLTTRAFAAGTGTDPAGPGSSLGALLTPGLRLGLLQAAVATVVLAVAAGRRLGRPVTEPQPVQIAGSELVSAVGNLLQQGRDRDGAAGVLRADLRRVVTERVALAPDAPAAALVDALAERTGRAPDELRPLVEPVPVRSDAELVALADRIDVVREEVLHGRAP